MPMKHSSASMKGSMMKCMMMGLSPEEMKIAHNHMSHMTAAEKAVMMKRCSMCMKDKHDGMDMSKMDAQKCNEMMHASNADAASDHQVMHAADGVVKSITPSGKVTLQHGAVKTLSWPAMTMQFAVKDKAMLAKMPVGSKVHVEFSKQGNEYVIGSVN